MAERGQPAATTIASAGAATQSCHLAMVCAPAPLAIPGLFSHLDRFVPLQFGAASLTPTPPRGISPAPPFHPPRA